MERSAQKPSTRSRAVGRSLPQEGTGPRLRVLPRRRISVRSMLMLGAALFFTVLAGSVTIQAQRIAGQHEIDRLETQTVEAIDRNRDLRAQVAIAESPERIMAEANSLEMVQPGAVLPLVAGVAPSDPPTVQQPADLPATTGVPADGRGGADADSVTLGADNDQNDGTPER